MAEFQLTWLTGGSREPRWPDFPPEVPTARRHVRLWMEPELQDEPVPAPANQAKYANVQLASIWLNRARPLFNIAMRPWLRELALNYALWTAIANGSGLRSDEDIEHIPPEWNHAYFNLVAYCLPGLTLPEISELALDAIVSLPDEPFFDVSTTLIRSVDSVYFVENGLDDSVAVGVRAALADRLTKCSGWRRLAGTRTESIEFHIAPAIAAQFFNDRIFSDNKCYLTPEGAKRLTPFLPVLAALVVSAPCLFVALVACNLLEVLPQPAHVGFVVEAARIWQKNYPDDVDFWVDNAIGRRVCAWFEKFNTPVPRCLPLLTN